MIAGPGGPFVAIRRDRDTGFTSLRVDERRLEDHGQSVGVLMRAICRYEPDQDEWRRVPWPVIGRAIRLVPRTSVDARNQARVFAALPEQVGLFWVRWTETPTDGFAASGTAQEALAVSGPVLCNDVDLAPPPAGRMAACVPFADRAEARLVPTPPATCAP